LCRYCQSKASTAEYGRSLCLSPPSNKFTFDLLTLKTVSESRVTWATSVPILVFLGLSVLDLGPMYATDRRQTSDSIIALCPPPHSRGGGIIRSPKYCIALHSPYHSFVNKDAYINRPVKQKSKVVVLVIGLVVVVVVSSSSSSSSISGDGSYLQFPSQVSSRARTYVGSWLPRRNRNQLPSRPVNVRTYSI